MGSTVGPMACEFQVALDTADPHTLADWWAAALNWEVEPSDEDFIRRMVDGGLATDADTTRHRGVLVWREGAAIRPPDGAPPGPGSRIYFQRVPEPKTVKNRMHLDVYVGGGACGAKAEPERSQRDRLEAELARLVAAGATYLHRGQQGPHTWVTIADPEGNELCIT